MTQDDLLSRVTIIAGNFPSPGYPNRGAFVYQLVHAFAALGVECNVIAPLKPLAWWKALRVRKRKYDDKRLNGTVVHPLAFSFSNRAIFGWNTISLSFSAFNRAAKRAAKKLPMPDFYYGHFLYPSGACAMKFARDQNVPGFVAVGEGTLRILNSLGRTRRIAHDRLIRDFNGVSGLVAVSGVIKRRLILELGFERSLVGLFPNGFDPDKFFPLDRHSMRVKYGLPIDDFIVIYVGNFIESKGCRRVLEAVRRLENVSVVFVGSGPISLEHEKIVFKGNVGHSLVSELMSAADCFALPSDVEGSSNASIEAMACGLPVVISKGGFNEELQKDLEGCFVDAEDIVEIRSAIVKLRDDLSYRAQCSRSSLSLARDRDIHSRAANLHAWMVKRVVEARGEQSSQ